ncbi:PAP2 superfamily protein [Lachnospiraceae bacterium C7]|nr:PAP2 superfamily protein [Lachnospiraceae bacterium C7]
MTQVKYYVQYLFDKCKHLFILLYFIPYLVGFNFIEKNITTHFHVIETPLDRMIPFCEYFVVPYMLWFAYVAWGVTYFALTDKKIHYRLCGFLFTGMTIFLLVSIIYPNGQFLRPVYFAHHNIFTNMCQYIYASDTPTNIFPSIHVYNSIGIHLAIINSDKFKNRKIFCLMSGILATSIILSTMFIKQHSTFDVFTAFVLAYFMNKLCFDGKKITFSAKKIA